ncbi:MAG: NAD-dependent epimerase/dehydratase family protein [Candidatus Kaelpia imicola]|nr:NAD-dependent epimerase/dehydratase family protein [Candidatus Kaelpia imicola]
MKVLISGAAGMVGSHCAEFYAEEGNEIVGVDNLMRSKLFGSDKKSVEYNWEYLSGFKNIERIYLDIRDRDGLEEVFKKNDFELIVHAAAQPGVGYSIQNPAEDFSINAVGTFNMLEATRKHAPGASFIFCSTNKVYGENVSNYELVETEKRYSFKDIEGISETTGIDLVPHTPYGVSKYVGDIYLQEYIDSYNIKGCIFRMSCIYGRRQFGFEDQGWLAWFLIAAVTGKKITIYGDGKQVRDVLFVDDLVRAFNAFHLSGKKSGLYNIGGGPENTISLLEYLTLLEGSLSLKMDRAFSDWRPSDQKVYISDITKLKDELNWAPSIKLDKGLSCLAEWVNKNRELF